jgi:membrane fusion protein, heavy metal efflux system
MTLILSFVVLLGPGCGSDPGHGHSHGGGGGHDHAEDGGVTLARTRFTGTHELFVELDAPVAGQPYAYHAHVTRLADNHAATEGTLELRFEADGFVVETKTDPAPARPGIFAATAPAPGKTGTYTLRLLYSQGDERAEWSLGDVVVGSTEPVEHLEEPHGEITFLKEAQWQVPFRVERPVTAAIAKPLTLPATVDVDPRASAVLPAPTRGLVLWGSEGTIPVEGTAVLAGDDLGRLVPSGSAEHYARLQAGAQTARVDVGVAEQELSRVQQLVAEQLLPDRRLLEAQAKLETAQAQQTSAYRQLSGSQGAGVPIRAPRDGVITAMARHGTSIEAGAPLLTVGDPASIVIRGQLLGRDTAQLGDVSWATVQRGDWPAPKDLLAAGGAVLTKAIVVDPDTMASPVTAWVPDPMGLRPGDLVELSLGVGTGEPQLTVPRSAIVELNTRPVVFVMRTGESFSRVPVALGPADAHRVAVLSGLGPDDRVVVVGGFDVHVASLGGALESHRH